MALLGNGYERDAWKLARWDEFWATAQASECRWRGAHHILFDNSADGAAGNLEQALAAFTTGTTESAPAGRDRG